MFCPTSSAESLAGDVDRSTGGMGVGIGLTSKPSMSSMSSAVSQMTSLNSTVSSKDGGGGGGSGSGQILAGTEPDRVESQPLGLLEGEQPDITESCGKKEGPKIIAGTSQFCRTFYVAELFLSV